MLIVALPGNVAGRGGAVALSRDSSADMEGCSLRDNKAVATQGGTSSSDGGAVLVLDSKLLLRSCSVAGNTATGRGGAVHATGQSAVSLVHCSMVGNSAGQGGAVAATASSQLVANGSQFSANVATVGDGGAVLSEGNSTVRAQECLFQGNSANPFQGRGGAFFARMKSRNSTTLLDCSFLRNSAAVAGGLYWHYLPFSDILLLPRNCTFLENVPSDRGEPRERGRRAERAGGLEGTKAG